MKAFLAALLTAATGWQAGKKKAGTLLKLNARSEGNAAATLIYDHEEARNHLLSLGCLYVRG